MTNDDNDADVTNNNNNNNNDKLLWICRICIYMSAVIDAKFPGPLSRCDDNDNDNHKWNNCVRH